MRHSKHRFGHRVGLSVGLALLLGQGLAFSAESTFPLESIDFVSTATATEILLHTGSIVPYRTVLVSDNKLVLDIDKVDTQQTIQTNFAGAQNVSHVVLQPLSDKTIRLIVRGEHLGQPEIGFKEVTSTHTHLNTPSSEINPDALESETHKGFDALAAQNIKPASWNEKEAPLSDAAIRPESHPAATPSASFSAENRNLDLGHLTKNSALQHAASPEPSDFFAWLNPEKLGSFLQIGLLGGLLLAFGFFIRKKLTQLSAPKSQGFEDLAPERQVKGKRPRFQELANAYHQNQEKLKASTNTPKGRKNFNTEPPIGLRSLKNILDENDIPLPPKEVVRGSNRRLTDEDLAPLPPQQPLQNTMPKRQAVSQYQKQAQVAPSKPKRAVEENVLRREVQNSANAKQQMEALGLPSLPPRHAQASVATKPVSRAPLPQPTRNAATPKSPTTLPASNPEVLNFLRSVAEMMEKDGKTTMARKIQRQIKQS